MNFTANELMFNLRIIPCRIPINSFNSYKICVKLNL